MDFQSYWLLALPVFFGLGWLAARVDIRHLLMESRTLPASYFKGLNFLLNEQPDKAIEAFIEVARAEQQTIELHFALGSLFRRRGEVDRATRMHQTLVERTDLSAEQRTAALYELAQDYLKAGLLDRAEVLFQDLRKTDYSEPALRHLLDIYVAEKDWPKAIGAAEDLEKATGDSLRSDIANFHCELAAREHSHSRLEEARAQITAALEAHRKCVRANVMLGGWAQREGQHEEAVAIWKGIESQAPEYLFLIAQPLIDSMRVLGRTPEALTLLRGWLQRYPALDLLGVVFQATLEVEGADAALGLVREELHRNPSLGALDKFLEAQLGLVAPDQRADFQLMRDLVHAHSSRLSLYQCSKCGFKARAFHWHCPACGGWDTYPPRRNAEGEPGTSSARGGM
ncbi:MAG: lipopolysaccharide assembly protein LapB [Betaproteobacteria bacterium]|nr:lipopolysaccharide assembly protein LapB [Betaproteobacteria bacterium]